MVNCRSCGDLVQMYIHTVRKREVEIGRSTYVVSNLDHNVC